MKRETKSNKAGQELTNQTKQGQEQENPYMGTWGRETHKTQEHRTDILINSDIKTHFRLNIKNVHCAQVVLQTKFNYNFYISKSQAICQ